MRHKVEGSGSCSGAMKEIFRKNLPPQKKLPMYSCGEKTWNEFCSPWAMIPDTFYDHQNSAWLGLAFLAQKISMHISWLQRSCRFPETPLKHSMFHSYPCFEVSHFLPNNLVQRVSTDSNSEFGEARWCFFFKLDGQELVLFRKLHPLRRWWNERWRRGNAWPPNATSRTGFCMVSPGFCCDAILASSWALQLEHLPGM